MADIFLSYSRKDADRIEPFIKLLKGENWSVWWDYEILDGEEFPNAIKKEIKIAKCVVVLWSKHSIESKWVHIEANEADKRNILVPALIDDVEIPFQYSLLNTSKFYNWDGKTLPHPVIEKFLRSVKKKIDPSSSPDAPVIIESPPAAEPNPPQFLSLGNTGISFNLSKSTPKLFITSGLLVVILLILARFLIGFFFNGTVSPSNTSNVSPSPSITVSNNASSSHTPSNTNSATLPVNTTGNSTLAQTNTTGNSTPEQIIPAENKDIKTNTGDKRVIREIIVSETSSPSNASDLIKFLNSPQNKGKTSYHYIIDRDGSAHPMTDLNDIAGHTPNHNKESVGISLAHASGEAYSEAQINGLIDILAEVARKYNIPPENIKSKQEIDSKYIRDITARINSIREKVAEKLK